MTAGLLRTLHICSATRTHCVRKLSWKAISAPQFLRTILHAVKIATELTWSLKSVRTSSLNGLARGNANHPRAHNGWHYDNSVPHDTMQKLWCSCNLKARVIGVFGIPTTKYWSVSYWRFKISIVELSNPRHIMPSPYASKSGGISIGPVKNMHEHPVDTWKSYDLYTTSVMTCVTQIVTQSCTGTYISRCQALTRYDRHAWISSWAHTMMCRHTKTGKHPRSLRMCSETVSRIISSMSKRFSGSWSALDQNECFSIADRDFLLFFKTHISFRSYSHSRKDPCEILDPCGILDPCEILDDSCGTTRFLTGSRFLYWADAAQSPDQKIYAMDAVQ